MTTTIENRVSIPTPFNQPTGRLERRVLRDGAWVRPDAAAIALRRAVFGPITLSIGPRETTEAALNRARVVFLLG